MCITPIQNSDIFTTRGIFITLVHLEPCQTCAMESFAKKVNGHNYFRTISFWLSHFSEDILINLFCICSTYQEDYTYEQPVISSYRNKPIEENNICKANHLTWRWSISIIYFTFLNVQKCVTLLMIRLFKLAIKVFALLLIDWNMTVS